ncbi:MAG: LAGLIDADG family homing endonuclease [Promethearchaeota archaeon]
MHKVQRFEDFFRLFQDKPGVYKYQDQINDIYSKGGNALIILYEDILAYDSQIADLLKKDPQALLEDAVDAFKNILKFQSGGNLNLENYFVRITTKDEKSPLAIPIRGLRSKNIDKLVWFKGILIRISSIRPKLIKAFFECNLCGAQFEVLQLSSRIKWPKFCINKKCKAKAQSDFRLISKKSEFIDWQSITIQEVPEDLPPGRIPRAVQGILTYDLVDSVKPGDRIKVMGIFKSVLAQSTKNINSTLFKTFVDVNFIDPEDKSDEFIDISKEDKDKILKLSKEPMIQKKIARSLAPNIYGRDDLKMACALSLFSGTRKKMSGGNYKRGDIHVLFVGDPGTGKSQILKSAVEVSPRGLYTSGKGSTAVGLTAAVLKDPETGQMSLEAGAVVLANGGVAAIDEFDKMDTADRSALHEAMEQQSYHYNTEILTTDGERIIIGKFIDSLMAKHKDKVIQGKNCEILPFNDLELYSTNFKKIYKTRINRISRHEAPDYFYKISFTNGRSIVVTPEHPVYIFKDGDLKNIIAEKCSVNDFIPIPKSLPNSNKLIELQYNENLPHPIAKEVKFPNYLTTKLSRILGYLVTEGHSYKGSAAEIGFSNMDGMLLEDFNELMLDLFAINPTINERNDGLITLRYISIELFKWMLKNFPEVMVISKRKRIPSKILANSIRIAKEFLISAFKGDGSVESTSICYRTSSKGLSTDYQDLLLKLGIHSRIIFDKFNNSYKVYIHGQSLIQFYNEIVEKDDKRIEKITLLIKPDKIKTHHHDIFPTSIINKIIKLKKDLAIPYDGYFDRHLKQNHGFTRNIFQKELEIIKSKFNLIKNSIEKFCKVKDFRTKTGYSQYNLAYFSGLTRGSIEYYERGGYDKSLRYEIKSKIISSLREKCKCFAEEIKMLNSFVDSEILWDRIKSIEIIQNKGRNYNRWVYDITIEPNHTFIGQGIVLHNTVSIAKAGIVATLKSETAIMAAANPHFGRYDRYKTPPQNIRMPPSLLSRFDLIFIVIDKPDKIKDAQMAEHILQSSMIASEDNIEGNENIVAPISGDLLKKYIKYARRNYHPILTEEAKERIKEFYLELRGEYDSEDAIVSILARNLDALVRLSEAYAKMALRHQVLQDDVEEIIKLFKRYLKDTGYDETSGKIDVDRLLVGQSRNVLNKLDKLLTRLKEIFEENNYKALDKKNVIQILELEEDLDREFIEKALNEFINDGTLYEPKNNQIKFTKRIE